MKHKVDLEVHLGDREKLMYRSGSAYKCPKVKGFIEGDSLDLLCTNRKTRAITE